MDDLYTLGVDVGSSTSKCVILKNGTEIAATSLVPAGTGTGGPGRALAAALERSGLRREQLAAVTATGYGRNAFDCGADFTVSELSCHAVGAAALCPGVRTVVDIGGQDAKALRIGANGRLESFLMNDKCAAGTGRFLEVMARVLEADVADLAGMDERASGRVNISSTCTVFAESAVIPQLSRNVDLNDLVAGRDTDKGVNGEARRFKTDVPAFNGAVHLFGFLAEMDNAHFVLRRGRKPYLHFNGGALRRLILDRRIVGADDGDVEQLDLCLRVNAATQRLGRLRDETGVIGIAF